MYYSVVRGPNRIAIHGWSVGLVGRLPVAVPRATERACWVESQALACSVLSLYMSLSLLGGLSHCRMRCERCLCQSERRHVERASGEQRARIMRCTMGVWHVAHRTRKRAALDRGCLVVPCETALWCTCTSRPRADIFDDGVSRRQVTDRLRNCCHDERNY